MLGFVEVVYRPVQSIQVALGPGLLTEDGPDQQVGDLHGALLAIVVPAVRVCGRPGCGRLTIIITQVDHLPNAGILTCHWGTHRPIAGVLIWRCTPAVSNRLSVPLSGPFRL